MIERILCSHGISNVSSLADQLEASSLQSVCNSRVSRITIAVVLTEKRNFPYAQVCDQMRDEHFDFFFIACTRIKNGGLDRMPEYISAREGAEQYDVRFAHHRKNSTRSRSSEKVQERKDIVAIDEAFCIAHRLDRFIVVVVID